MSVSIELRKSPKADSVLGKGTLLTIGKLLWGVFHSVAKKKKKSQRNGVVCVCGGVVHRESCSHVNSTGLCSNARLVNTWCCVVAGAAAAAVDAGAVAAKSAGVVLPHLLGQQSAAAGSRRTSRSGRSLFMNGRNCFLLFGPH